MKKLLLLVVICFSFLNLYSQEIEIKDENMIYILKSKQIKKVHDNFYSQSELNKIRECVVYKLPIPMELAHLHNLNKLTVYVTEGQSLDSIIDVSHLQNQLKELKVMAPYKLRIGNQNRLEKLEIIKCPDFSIGKCDSLVMLSCIYGNYGELNLKNLPQLTYLDCSNSNVTKLIVSGNHNLKELKCNDNNLKELDLSKNANLKLIHCTGNKFDDIKKIKFPSDIEYIYIGKNFNISGVLRTDTLKMLKVFEIGNVIFKY